jgi:nickel-dependent lactate racemase
MSSVLRYGADSSLSLDFPDGVLLAECGTPQAPPLNDPAAATGAALSEPLDYPPLALCTTPGDRVVLALDERVPQGGQIAAAVIQALASGGVHPDGLTVLRTARDAEAGLGDPSRWLPEELRARVTLASHDPDDRQAIAYMAASDEGQPILLNRLLTDADLVLPIGCVRHRGAAGYHGVHSPIFPNFSDRRTLLRFLARESGERPQRGKKDLIEEADHVGWLLGVAFTIQVVPGPGDRLLHVLAGQVGEVRRRGQELYEDAWRCSVPRRASLVVAAIEGGSDQQTWENVGRALAAAGRLVEDDGAIAICSELDSEPGPALAQLRTAAGREEAVRNIRRNHPPDALSAAQLLEALDRVRVYLLSQLDEMLVEDLEIAPIAEADELVRLTERHASCILLSNAPHAMVTAEESG